MRNTSKLKSIVKKESWPDKQDPTSTWTKYIFSFANGHTPFVYRTDKLNYKIGTELEYEYTQELPSGPIKAKIITKNPKPMTVQYSNSQEKTQTSIEFQSARNCSAIVFQGQGEKVTPEFIHNFTIELFKLHQRDINELQKHKNELQR